MKRRSLVLVCCVELVRMARKKKKDAPSSRLSCLPPSRLSSRYRSALVLRSCRLVSVLVLSLSAFSRSALLSYLYCSANHLSSLPACACYLIGYRLVLSDKKRRGENETPHETLLCETRTRRPRDAPMRDLGGGTRRMRKNARAYLIERDKREKKRRPAYSCEPPRPSSYRALIMASLVRHLA